MAVFRSYYRGNDGQVYGVFAVDHDDETPVHEHWVRGNYDARCSACYLGYAHSRAFHERRVKKHSKRRNDGTDGTSAPTP